MGWTVKAERWIEHMKPENEKHVAEGEISLMGIARLRVFIFFFFHTACK